MSEIEENVVILRRTGLPLPTGTVINICCIDGRVRIKYDVIRCKHLCWCCYLKVEIEILY